MSNLQISVRVQGEYALLTRPESKVERVSYPILTPSAAQGTLDSIYWHPQFSWRIQEIRVLNPVKTFSLLRNEVNSKMSPDRREPYFADEDRTQRHAVCLRDVDYVVVAEPEVRPGFDEHPRKFVEQFQRRVQRGQCHHRPVLGTREFAAEFLPADDAPEPIDWTEDLGLMLWGLDYSTGRRPHLPLFFAARVEKGVMRVPRHPIGREA